MPNNQGTQSLSRAFKVLKIVAQKRGAVSLNYLVQQSGFNRTTAYRLAMGLAAEGMLKAEASYFSLGPECYVLGIAANQYFGVNNMAKDTVSRLAIKSGDSAFFSVRSDCSSVCVIREDGDHPLKTVSLQPGTRHPLGIGAAGLAMLSSLPDDEVDRCLFTNAEWIRTAYPTFTPGNIRLEVAETRARGYAFNRGKVTAGSWGMGVAISDPRGVVIGAISISAVLMRMQEERQKDLSQLLFKEKEKLEEKLRSAESPTQ